MPARRSSSAPASNAAPLLPDALQPARDHAPPAAVLQTELHVGAEATPTPGTAEATVDAREGRRSVLVAVVNNPADLRRAAEEGWYRIPQRSAPRRIGADYLALYLTSGAAPKGSQSAGAHTVACYAATRRYRLVSRRDLIPDEPNHPRAGDAYFRIDIGPLQPLEHPVPAATFKRLTFIHTTLAALLAAQDVTDLFRKDDPFDRLWDALREHKLRPLKNRLINDAPVDIALRARSGTLAINCRDEFCAQEARPLLLAERWALLTLPTSHIENDLDGCLRRIGSALLGLGGSVLNG